MNNPLISVILPVYNSEKYIFSSINSILKQTFTQFELLILNDGSNDTSNEIINSFKDKRIRFFFHENIGLSNTLNKGINLSRAPLIARQDADDISHPRRLELQFKYMQMNPECSLLGTAAQIIDGDHLVNRYLFPPKDHIDCKYKLLFENCFVHTSVMIRKSILQTVGFYSISNERRFAEDYDLWSRISEVSTVSNLIEILVYYRDIPDSLSKQNNLHFNSCVINISAQNLSLFTGRNLNDPIAKSLASIMYGPPFSFKGLPNFIQIDLLIFKITNLLKSSKNYHSILREAFIRCLIYRFYWLIKCTYISYIFKILKSKFKFSFKFWKILKDKYMFTKFR